MMKNNNLIYDYEVDVSVSLIFFNRPETLEKVFSVIKKARPSRLFLIQDGPRSKSDYESIQMCREIVSDIDWKCQVYNNYSELNMGCGNRPFSGIDWVFSITDKAIILEDDCVPDISFFSFAKNMLDLYENDLRIGIISGTNYHGLYDFGSSYGFSKSGSIWGWATWKNRWEKYDFHIKHLQSKKILELLLYDVSDKKYSKKRIHTWEKRALEIDLNNKKSYWDFQWGYIRHINSWLSIVPSKNLISNIGIGINSTHSGSNLRLLPPRIRNFYFMKTYQFDEKIEHPSHFIPDRKYDLIYYKRIYKNRFTIFLETLFYAIKKRVVYRKK